MDKLLLRPTEAADVIGYGRSKTYALIANGTIPSIVVGGSRRVPVDALKTWIAKQVAEQAESSR